MGALRMKNILLNWVSTYSLHLFICFLEKSVFINRFQNIIHVYFNKSVFLGKSAITSYSCCNIRLLKNNIALKIAYNNPLPPCYASPCSPLYVWHPLKKYAYCALRYKTPLKSTPPLLCQALFLIHKLSNPLFRQFRPMY